MTNLDVFLYSWLIISVCYCSFIGFMTWLSSFKHYTPVIEIILGMGVAIVQCAFVAFLATGIYAVALNIIDVLA